MTAATAEIVGFFCRAGRARHLLFLPKASIVGWGLTPRVFLGGTFYA